MFIDKITPFFTNWIFIHFKRCFLKLGYLIQETEGFLYVNNSQLFSEEILIRDQIFTNYSFDGKRLNKMHSPTISQNVQKGKNMPIY